MKFIVLLLLFFTSSIFAHDHSCHHDKLEDIPLRILKKDPVEEGTEVGDSERVLADTYEPIRIYADFTSTFKHCKGK